MVYAFGGRIQSNRYYENRLLKSNAWDKLMTRSVASKGHLNMLKWAYENILNS